ncbi:MAG: hypothetical protein AB7F74_04035 [Parvibaculaceae bacterium]
MYRLFAVAMAASLALGLSTGMARAECREGILVCETQCPELRSDANNRCVPRCRTVIICEVEPSRAARSSLPGSALPADRLPKSRLPKSQLPDSFLN